MKKLYSILIGLLLLTSLQGQILRYSNYNTPAPTPPANDYYDEYDTIYAAFDTKPHDTIADLQEAMVYSLDTLDYVGGASVWDRIVVFYVFAAHLEADESLVNWVDPGTYDADNPTATAWTQWEGYTGNGSGADPDYISTNYTPSADSTIFKRNSASFGIYIRNDAQHADAIFGSSAAFRFIVRNTSNIATSNINSTDNQTYASAANSTGLWIATRTATANIELYRNGSSVDTETDASTGMSTAETHILKRNGSSAGTAYQVAIFFIMNGVTDGEVTAINTIIETYMDAIGKGVE